MALQLNNCKGLFVLNDGNIIHFVQTRGKDDKFIFGIELFSKDGQFLGWTSLSEQTQKFISLLQNAQVLWKDKDDRFYFRIYKNDFPVISVMSMKYKISP